MVSEFVAFLQKTNALALAVAVIIGAAIGKVVTSIVGDVIMPGVGLALGGGDWRGWVIPLKTAPAGKVIGIGAGDFLRLGGDLSTIPFHGFLVPQTLLQPPPPPPPRANASPQCL